MNNRVCGIHWEKRRIKHTQMKGKRCNLLKQFSYDLEMKTREQNRNNKRMETERFDWFIERIETRVAFGWLSEHSGEKTSFPRTFWKSTDTSLSRHTATRLANHTMPSPY